MQNLKVAKARRRAAEQFVNRPLKLAHYNAFDMAREQVAKKVAAFRKMMAGK
jgi:hypothetical protein